MFRRKPSLKELLPPPVKADHGEYSMILSAHDDRSRPTNSLIQISLKAIEQARTADLSDLSARLQTPPLYPEIWPGEHYKFLAGLVLALQPKLVIEVGTATGLSALCLKKFLPKGGQIASFDIVPWENYPNTVLCKEDFSDPTLTQHISDLSDPVEMTKHLPLLKKADLFFIDAVHDGVFEQKLLSQLEILRGEKPLYLCFDDIRVWSMLKMWREICWPKIDLTSFGHWSGTGLIELR
jgi:predicted O-methyltransferase YrrM